MKLPHIPALDGIRGLGVLGILLFHAGHLRGGWLGVDLFFVLSGFLITSLLLFESAARGRISLGRFWARRARRLLPALFLALLGVAAYAVFVADPEDLPRIRGDGIATLFYVANWHALLAGHEYWDLFRAPAPLDHTWSLAIEEQFYLLWPPLVLLATSRFSRAVPVVAIVALSLALLSALWMALLFDPAEGTARVYFGTDTRAAATLVGAALAATLMPQLRRWPGHSSRLADGAALAATAFLAWAWTSFDGVEPLVYRGGLFACAAAAAVMMTGVVLAPTGIASRVFSVAPLRFLGLVSYGVYLWHWPLYLLLSPERTGVEGVRLTAIRIAASLGVAVVSYFALERPIRRGALSSRLMAGAGVASTVLVAVTLVAVTRTPARDLANSAMLIPVGRDPDLLLVGDSVAESLGPALRERAAARGLEAVALGSGGCLVMDNDAIRFGSGRVLQLGQCDAFRSRWRSVAAETHPHAVLIVEAGTFLGARLIEGTWQQPCTPGYDSAFESDLSEAIRFFDRHGARTAIVTAPMALVEDTTVQFRRQSGALDPEILRPRLEADVTCQNELRRSVARDTGAVIVELSEFVCPGGRCIREIDGVRLRRDGVHFERGGAHLVADWLLDQLSAQGLL